jgi:hypothetical protein
MESAIIESIRYRRVIQFEYEGMPRTVNPHVFYRSEASQKGVINGWQTEGGSNTRTPPCWGNFSVVKIVGLVLLEETFSGAQPDFKRHRFRNVICSL